jgi:hypothetical protein
MYNKKLIIATIISREYIAWQVFGHLTFIRIFPQFIGRK